MFGLGLPELLILLVILLMLFGVGKLPQVAEMMGEGVRKFRDALEEEENGDRPSELIEEEGEEPR